MRYRLDLLQLQVLDALLQEPSPTRVAAKMGLTQSGVSNILRRLRDHFEDELFIQSGRRMLPTPFAEGLVGPVRDLLLKADVVGDMRPFAEVADMKRTVRIGVSDFVACVLLAPVFQRAAIEAPNLKFDLFSVLDSRQTYHEDLDRGDVDLLLVPEAYAAPNHPSEVVLREEFVCVACRDNEALCEGLDLERYLSVGHVVLAGRPGVTPTYVESELARLGHSRRIEISAPSFLLIPEMLVGTRRIATVHAGLARHFQARWPIQVLPCPAPLRPMLEVMQWHAYQDRDPAIAWLRGRIAERAAELLR